jgi:hypothetical protein
MFAGAAREDAVQHLVGRQPNCTSDILESRALQGSLLQRLELLRKAIE